MSEMWEHQKLAVEKAMPLNEYGFLFEPGCGKTRTTIEVLRRKFAHHKRILRTLILCPGVAVENWRREILMFSKIESKDIHTLTGPGALRLGKFLNHAKTPQIFICNYESLLMKPLLVEFLNYNFEVLVCDESHRLKNHTAKRTKAAIQIADRALYRYILSGTPILNSLMDVYSQFRVLDKGERFGQNFFIFRGQYFYDRNGAMPGHIHFPDWVLRPNMDCLISDMMAERTMFVEKSKCLDLPPLVRKPVHIELSTEQRRIYDEMKKNFITFVNSKACTADLAITKALRLQQIVSGFIKLDPIGGEPGQILKLKENPRADALEELLEDLIPNHKVLIWACFRENYAQIRAVCERLGTSFVELHGEVAGSKRQENIDAFNNDGAVRCLIGNPGSGGISVNLVQASYSIYYSRDFNLEHDIQSEARNHRGGSEIHEKITRIDLIARDTIDEHVLQSLATKQELSSKVLINIARNL